MPGELGAAKAGAQAGQLSASGAPYPAGASGGRVPSYLLLDSIFPKDSEERVAYQHVADAIRDRYDLGRLANNVILPQYYQIREFNRINTMCLQTLLLIRGNYYTEALPSYAITELMLEITNDFITGLHHLTRANPKATEIIDWLSSHLDADLTVRGLADHFEMNYRYVSRLIKKETGMTASRLILQKKLDIACGLLLKSNLPLKLIADQAYFNDEKYFLRCFKKQLGQTPTQYRQQYMDDFLLNDTRTREARR
ncbi:transcriptional regulator, AraC family [Limosilactobacillus oris F0423]|uniref:Transcriptional regulator, AraC family n=1 Tax=Limosilactobacillus oris F0423 TaxID=944562 RepID=A0ABN0D377_9LACO|nr:transcriptional regulator, AraC family [Limosilactobacillus oris F0423]